MMNVIRASCVVLLYIICFSTLFKANINMYTDVVHFTADGRNDMYGVVFAQTDYGITFYYCGQLEADISRKEDGIEVEGSHSFGMFMCDTDQFWSEAYVSYAESSDYEVTGIPHLTLYYNAGEGYFDAYGMAVYNDLWDANLPLL